ncbi:MAG: hypothetical protein ACRDLA_17940, partial [Thermoleophilaceae bacterium]
ADPEAGLETAPATRAARRRARATERTAVLADEDGDETEPLPPPEFEPYRPEPGEQLHLGGDETGRQPPGEG